MNSDIKIPRSVRYVLYIFITVMISAIIYLIYDIFADRVKVVTEGGLAGFRIGMTHQEAFLYAEQDASLESISLKYFNTNYVNHRNIENMEYLHEYEELRFASSECGFDFGIKSDESVSIRKLYEGHGCSLAEIFASDVKREQLFTTLHNHIKGDKTAILLRYPYETKSISIRGEKAISENIKNLIKLSDFWSIHSIDGKTILNLTFFQGEIVEISSRRSLVGYF